MPSLPFTKYLDRNGDGTGSIEGNANFSGANTDFFMQVSAASRITLTNFILVVGTQTPGGLDLALKDYGNIINGVANGVSIKTVLNGATTGVFDGLFIKNYADLMEVFSESNMLFIQNKDMNRILGIHFKGREEFPLNQYSLTTGDKIVVTLHDDFSALYRHRFIIKGISAT